MTVYNLPAEITHILWASQSSKTGYVCSNTLFSQG